MLTLLFTYMDHASVCLSLLLFIVTSSKAIYPLHVTVKHDMEQVPLFSSSSSRLSNGNSSLLDEGGSTL